MSDTTVATQVQESPAGKEVQVIETDGDVVSEAIQSIADGNAIAYSSLTGTDWATKLATLQAVTNSEPVRDNLNRPINVKNILIQAINITDPNTGEVVRAARIVFLDDENNAFHAISNGLLKSVQNILGILKEPSTWPSPVALVFKEKAAKGPGRYMTIEFANVHKVAKK